jgi:hypothetical protein
MNLLQKGDLPRSACVLGVATNESKVQHGTGTVYHWYAHEALARYSTPTYSLLRSASAMLQLAYANIQYA